MAPYSLIVTRQLSVSSIIRLPLSLYFLISDRNEVLNTRNPALMLLVYQWAQYQDCEERERSFQWEFTSDLPPKHISAPPFRYL